MTVTRLDYAATLYRQQEAQYLIITETGERIPGVRSSLSDMAVKRAIDHGVEEDRIIITNGKSQNTVDEAEAVRQAVEDHNLTPPDCCDRPLPYFSHPVDFSRPIARGKIDCPTGARTLVSFKYLVS